MTNQELGVRNFRCRLAVAIRDGVLNALDNPASEATYRNIPLAELGPVAELTADQRTEWKKLIAGIIDRGIHHFLYGLDNQADGFEIRYEGALLNDEGTYPLSSAGASLADVSEFDAEGNRKLR